MDARCDALETVVDLTKLAIFQVDNFKLDSLSHRATICVQQDAREAARRAGPSVSLVGVLTIPQRSHD